MEFLGAWRTRGSPDERRYWGRAGPELPATVSTASHTKQLPQTLAECGALVISTPDPLIKAEITHSAYQRWSSGTVLVGCAQALDAPARPKKPQLVRPREVPSAKDLAMPVNVHMLHTLAHIELNAIDLAWDTVVRFSSPSFGLERQFFADFVHVADDESRHFGWCCQRLEELGSFYGCMPAHDLLWRDCQKTSGSIEARLAVIPMVQEARGLDAGPRLVQKLEAFGDARSAAIVQQIAEEEVAHVAVGVAWFLWLCEKMQWDPEERFRDLMAAFSVDLKGPFNHAARSKAGLLRSWYDSA